MSPIHSSWLALGARWALSEGMARDRTVESMARRVTARVRTARAAQSRVRGADAARGPTVVLRSCVAMPVTLLYVK